MKTKKNPKYNLEDDTRLFFLLGLTLTLFVVYYALEHSTPERTVTYDFTVQGLSVSDEPDVMEIEVEEPEPQPVQKTEQVPVIADDIKIIADDDKVEESVIESTEIAENEAVTLRDIPEPEEDIQEVEVEEEVHEDVPFRIIEQPPVYPGCKGDKQKLKKCMEERIKEHINREFDTELAQELGLSPGIKKIYVQFIIDEKGKITGIKTRAPHRKLAAEAQRVIQSLPVMNPGKQRGKPVRVRYNLPIVFQVLGDE